MEIMAKNIINIFFFKDYYFIFLLLNCFFIRVLSDNCIIESFPDLQYLKSETLLNGYILMMTTTGIYSFNPLNSITKFEFSYNFTEEQILSYNDIFNAQISQFSNVNEGNDYVLCYVKNFIYVLNNKGKYLFYENLDIPHENINFASIIAYQYKYSFYNFFLIYISKEDQNCYFFINNYRLTIKKEEHNMTLYYKNTFDPTKGMDQTKLYNGGLSCEIMTAQESPKNVLVCFIIISYLNYLHTIMSLEIEPDTFSVTNSSLTLRDSVVSLSSSVGEDKSSAFVCYMRTGGTANCLYYILNEKKFSENDLFEVNCIPQKYLFNLYYFPQPKEFIFSCFDYNNNLVIKKLNDDFELIPTNFEDSKKFNCNGFSSYSIFYLLNIKQYITISQCNCDNNIMIRLFLIMDNCDEFNKTQLYIKNENTLDISNINELNDSEYIIKTNEILKNTDNYEQPKSEKFQNTTIMSYLTDLEHEQSNINIVILSTEQITNKDKEIYLKDKTENIEISNGNNYSDNQISESNTQSLGKSTYYHSEKIAQESSNFNKEMTDSNKEQLTYSNSEIIEKESELSSEIFGKITYFNSTIPTEKMPDSDKIVENSNIIISQEKCICGENLSYFLLKNKECINYCNVEQLLDKICQIDCISINNFNSIKRNIESIIHKDNFTDNKEIVIVGNNIICDILTSKMEHKNKNISYIDFGECETKLKQENNIDYLLIIKFDAKLNENSPTNVQYKVYDPITKRELDLSICSDDKINIDIPLILVGESRDLYQNFSSMGYDILNIKDPFYNDICTTFSSNNNTDIILSDRRMTYYNENLILCEKGCEYSSYDLGNNLVKCKCFVKNYI